MPLKLVIEREVSSKEEYELMKKTAKLGNETWKLLDPGSGKCLEVDPGCDIG